jgi:ankyrin repeat protein
VIYVYCDYNDTKSQEPAHIFASFAQQLVEQHKSMPRKMKDFYEEHKHGRVVPTLNECKVLCEYLSASFDHIYLFVDALDECSDHDNENCRNRSELITALQNSFQQRDNLHSYRLFITSREDDFSKSRFSNVVEIKIAATTEDIRRYARTRLASSTGFQAGQLANHPTLRDEIVKQLEARANGMYASQRLLAMYTQLNDHCRFLLTRLHLDALESSPNIRALRENLRTLPVKLNDIYIDALNRIKRQPAAIYNVAIQVLAWVLCAVRPLHIKELQHAIAVEPGDQDMDVEGLTDAAVIVSSCCGLVFVNPLDSTVQFVHLTVQEYLSSFRNTWLPRAEHDVGRNCLTYLSFDEFSTGTCDRDEDFTARLETYPFLTYAAENWGYHVQGHMEKELQELILGFLENGAGLASSVQVMDIVKLRYRNHAQRYRRHVTDLQMAAAFGLQEIGKILLEEGADLDARNSSQETALYLGAADNHEAVVTLLLDKGAHVNAQGGEHGSILQVAAFKGHGGLVRTLISCGAMINEQCGRSGNALQAAASRGHENIVKLLLDRGAKVNVQGGPYGTALRAAISEGHLSTAILLLDRGADINATGGCLGSPLRAAAWGGHGQIVDVLLDRGVDIDSQTGFFSSALRAAAWKGHEQIVRQLLANDDVVAAHGRRVDNALRAASLEGHDRIVALLLTEKGANVNGQGGIYGSALQAAASEGHDDIASFLLRHGAEINASGGIFGSPIQAAAWRGHKTIVQLLLSQGADIEANGGRVGSAVRAASSEGHESIVKLLLDNGADVENSGRRVEGALHAAAWRGHDATVQRLLANGADVHKKDLEGATALHLAAVGGHVEIVKMLLEKGGKIEEKDGMGETAMEKARHQKGVLELLKGWKAKDEVDR